MIGAYIFIILGLVFLGINFGYLNESIWSIIWKFWPVLLIFFGISVLTKKTLPKNIGIMLGVIIIIGTLGSIVYISWNGNILPAKQTPSSTEGGSLIVDEPLSSSTKNINLTIKLGAQKIDLDSTESGLIDGQISNNTGTPKIVVVNQGNTAKIDITTQYGSAMWSKGRRAADTHLSVTNQVPINMTLKLGATEINADLSNLIVDKLNLNVGAFSGQIKFGSRQRNNKTEINAGASDIKIYIPRSSGLRVVSSNGLVSMKYSNLEIIKTNDTRENRSSNYDSATNKIDLNLKAGASSIEFIGY
jgi:hypothetical protein